MPQLQPGAAPRPSSSTAPGRRRQLAGCGSVPLLPRAHVDAALPGGPRPASASLTSLKVCPSTVAHTSTDAENRRRAQLECRLAALETDVPVNTLSESRRTCPADALEHNPRDFLAEVSILQARIEDCTKSVRMQKFKTLSQQKGEEEQRAEEEKRKKEAMRLAKIRQMAADAQHPKKRVQLRLDEFREFRTKGQGLEVPQRVPMRAILDPSGSCKMRCEVVDVNAIQVGCLGLRSSRCGVSGLLEEKQRADSVKRWETEAFGPDGMTKDFQKINKDSTHRCGSSLRSSVSLPRPSSDDRLAQARLRRAKADEELLAHKVCALKGAWNLEFSYVGGRVPFGHHQSPMSNPEDLLDSALFLGEDGQRRLGCNPSSQDEAERLARRLLLASRVRRLWRLLIGVVWVASLLTTVQTKHRAADAVRTSCKQWTKRRGLMDSMKRLRTRILLIQRHVRFFLVRKQAWIKEHSEVWILWEEHHLQAHFKKLSQLPKTAAEPSEREQSPRGGEGMGMRSSMPRTRKAATNTCDYWVKTLRIPPEIREASLKAWYNGQLRKSIRTFQIWMDLLAACTRAAEDIRRFKELCDIGMKSLGSQPSVQQTPDVSRPRFRPQHCESVAGRLRMTDVSSGRYQEIMLLRFHETQVLDLVAEAAYKLKKTSPAFEEHPGNKALIRGARRGKAPSVWEATSCAKLHSSQKSATVLTPTPAYCSEVDCDTLIRNFAVTDFGDDSQPLVEPAEGLILDTIRDEVPSPMMSPLGLPEMMLPSPAMATTLTLLRQTSTIIDLE